ncbi:hypothetical protein K2X14_14125 [Acetobacter sp. TBRC 12305]|uniref:Uncharacterized protein n=1 Tax=Acetobacter garciniae TaxID=2817435 RepID=A0A939KP13_9PROT|nr:hypothetical protein [Acetobacter garciniae]MBO1326290.1 hypothetical protein [Acetobacter garciniae]MBX0345971.1 hypothetical protein [Acetobacter garciniae]
MSGSLTGASTASSPISALLTELDRQQKAVPEEQRGLTRELEELRQRLEKDPSLENDAQYCTQVAWLIQDWQKFSGTGQAPVVSPLLAGGLQAFASQYPGLQNPTLEAMLGQTEAIQDRALLNDIRRSAVEMSTMPPEQQSFLLVRTAVENLAARATDAGMVLAAAAPGVAADPNQGTLSLDNGAIAQPVPVQATPAATPVAPVADVAPASAADPAQEEISATQPAAAPVAEVAPVQAVDAVPEQAVTAQDAAPVEQQAAEQTVASEEAAGPRHLTKEYEEQLRNEAAQINNTAENTPPEANQTGQNSPSPAAEKVKARDQGEGASQATENGWASKEKEQREKNLAAQASQSAQQATPAQSAPKQSGSIAGHVISKMANGFASWSANNQAESDRRRIDKLTADIDRNAAQASENFHALKRAAGPFFQKLEATAAQEGVKVPQLLKGMTEGSKNFGLWQEFTRLRMNDPGVQFAYEALTASMSDMRRNLTSLQGEAEQRGATQNQAVVQTQDKAGKLALEMEGVPGMEPGKTLIQSIGGIVEKLMEKMRSFLGLDRQKEQKRETEPSRGP